MSLSRRISQRRRHQAIAGAVALGGAAADFTVKAADGGEFAVPTDVKAADGSEFTVPTDVKAADGGEFDTG